MRQLSGGLNPAQELAQRLQTLEAELLRARRYMRRNKKHNDAGHWRLGSEVQAQQEEGWFVTYLDVMTLLLVAMLVMLAFSGTLSQQRLPEPAVFAYQEPENIPDIAQAAQAPIPEPSLSYPYPAWTDSSLATAFADERARPAEIIPEPEIHAPYPAMAEAAETPVSSISAQLAVDEHLAPYPALPETMFMARTASDPEPAVKDNIGSASLHQTDPFPDEDASSGEDLAASLALGELGQDVEVIIKQRSVSFRINNEILFDTGQADLSRGGLSVLQRTAKVLANAGYDITVEGHTDSVPVRRNARYPSNWELSSARAGSVVRYLQANGIEKTKLRAVGYADTRPIAANDDARGRMQNRRVELMIQKPDPAE